MIENGPFHAIFKTKPDKRGRISVLRSAFKNKDEFKRWKKMEMPLRRSVPMKDVYEVLAKGEMSEKEAEAIRAQYAAELN